MKVLLVFLITAFLCSYHLAGYSSIPEYSSSPSVAYSSIPSYSSPDNERECVVSTETSENKIDSLDADSMDTVYSEGSYENLEAPREESSKLAEISPLMMARGPLTYNGQLKLDDDGHGLSHGDPHHQSTTSLQKNGKSLNPDYDSYVVAPRWLLTQGVRAGDRADVTAYFENDLYQNGVLISSTPVTKTIQSIVGDIGPASDNVGEISIKAALDLGFSFRDVPGKGPIPTYHGSDADIYITVTYYPSGS